MPKIAMIGAGSVIFTRNLIRDFLSFENLQQSEICLMDIDAERLELARRMTEKVIELKGVGATVSATLDRQEALTGADYVIIMIQVGGLDAYQLDIDIPLKYGIDQTVGDTLGPGGVFRGMRTVPVLVEILRDMERLCPNAYLLNYSNPMAINCWGMFKASKIKSIGLCHSVQGTAELLADYVGVPRDEVDYWCAGINHMSWYLSFRHNGEDLYPRFKAALDNPEVYKKDMVRFEALRHFDYFVTESSHHFSEYVPYFRKRSELIEKFVTPRWDYLQICRAERPKFEAEVRAQIAGEEPIPMDRSHEYGAPIISALEGGDVARINGNLENTGLITNLPQGACVEVPCLIDKTGIRPCYVGDLPAQCASLCRSNIAVQELAVEAALEGDRRKAFHAVTLDPLTSAMLDLAQIQRMVDELFEAEARWLPQFA